MGFIKNGDILPGDYVSTDQFECRVEGRLPNTRGGEDYCKMFYRGHLFVDHESSCISIYNKVSLCDSDIIRSKNLYDIGASETEVKMTS